MAGVLGVHQFLDRWHGSDRTAIFPGKRVILTIPFEDTTAAAPPQTAGILTEALNYVGAEVVATVLAPGRVQRPWPSMRMCCTVPSSGCPSGCFKTYRATGAAKPKQMQT